MSDAPDGGGPVTIGRAVEFEPSVTMTEEDFFDRGLQPLTLVILQSLWFLPQGREFSPESLASWFASLGWKGANGQPMSPKLLQRELRLLREAGFISATRIRGEKGRAAGIRYTVSKRATPANSAIHFADNAPVKPQVGPQVANDHRSSLPPGGIATKPQVGPQVANDHRSSLPPGGIATKPQVGPQVANGSTPPTPPPEGEEVITSSPNPLTTPDGPSPHSGPAARAAGKNPPAEITPEHIEAAVEWLQEALHAPFELGEPTARRYAPLLAERIQAQGWELNGELAAKLCANPGGLDRPDLALKRRIQELPRRRRQAASPRPGAPRRLFPHDNPDAERIGLQSAAETSGALRDLLASLRSPVV